MNYKTSLTVLVFLLLVAPTVLFAQQAYRPLVGIPGVTDPGLNFGDYINALYALSISVAALMAVIKIIIAGMKYMLSDVVTSKSEAISDIQGAVFGLIVVISAVLILTVINPQLTKTDVFIDPVVSSPKPDIPPAPGTIENRKGYKYAETGKVASFRTDCVASNGFYKIESDVPTGKTYEVCYDPLSSSMIAQIEADYAGLNVEAIKLRYQVTLFPLLDSSLKNAVAIHEGVDIADVLLAARSDDPGNWLDYRIESDMRSTCADLKKVTNKDVVFKKGPLAADSSYYACIID